mmetsp:Transcript_13764/g.32767  ORF Transcript_13764/g.32767 Transcript_13764/m.32767 type:complete len:218 (+) Transcript_13764:479-1132(+)
MCVRHGVHVSACPLAGRTDVWMDGWIHQGLKARYSSMITMSSRMAPPAIHLRRLPNKSKLNVRPTEPRRSPHSRPSVGVMSCGSRLGSSRRMPTFLASASGCVMMSIERMTVPMSSSPSARLDILSSASKVRVSRFLSTCSTYFFRSKFTSPMNCFSVIWLSSSTFTCTTHASTGTTILGYTTRQLKTPLPSLEFRCVSVSWNTGYRPWYCAQSRMH